MGRNKLIETQEIKILIDRLAIENPYKTITAADIARLANVSGYTGIEGRIINRNKEAKEYLDSINLKTDENCDVREYSVYSTLDVDGFIRQNQSIENLKKALIQRDTYYREVSNKNNKLIKENKKLKKQVEEIKSINSSELLKRINKLEKFINKYINPSIANELLAKEGLLKEFNSYTTINKVEVLPVTENFDNESLNKISRMFDDE